MIRRGDVRWYTFRHPNKRRPVVVLTRDSAIDYLHELTVAPITSTVRGIPTEIALSRRDGLQRLCAMNLDHVQTVAKERLGTLIVTLPGETLARARAALLFALGFD